MGELEGAHPPLGDVSGVVVVGGEGFDVGGGDENERGMERSQRHVRHRASPPPSSTSLNRAVSGRSQEGRGGKEERGRKRWRGISIYTRLPS